MDRTEQIKARAHELWEAEGRPEGRHDAHWKQAEAELSAERGEVPDGADVEENPYLPLASDASPDGRQDAGTRGTASTAAQKGG